MNLRALLLYGILSVFILITSISYGQMERDGSGLVALVTDRNLFVAGEQLAFSAVVVPADGGYVGNPSVMYVEVVSTEGQRLVSQKFPINGGQAYGVINLPDQLPTAYYLLRAYTRHQWSLGLSRFGYCLIKVVNAQNPQLLEAINREVEVGSEKNDLGSTVLARLTTDKTRYQRRENGLVNLNFVELIDSVVNASISIVPSASIFSQTYHPVFADTSIRPMFLNEFDGISLTGQVVVENSMLPVPNKRINLSVIGSQDFVETVTDKNGRFGFGMPAINGMHDVFISVKDTSKLKMAVQVDNDFAPCLPVVNPPVMQFNNTDAGTTQRMLVNYLVANNMKLLPQPDSVDMGLKKPPFYGIPDQTMVLDEFIQLPTLEEYFNELPFLVKVRKEKHRKYFKLFASQKELSLYEPLVLVDFVAINNPESVLAISPLAVDRIEFIHHLYQRGDVLYGGIVSIISKHGNFAGVDLPSNGMFLNYRFFAPEQSKPPIDLAHSNLPDVRNTIAWQPKISATPKGDYSLRFATSDTPGSYVILLQFVMKSGQLIKATCSFSVD